MPVERKLMHLISISQAKPTPARPGNIGMDREALLQKKFTGNYGFQSRRFYQMQICTAHGKDNHKILRDL